MWYSCRISTRLNIKKNYILAQHFNIYNIYMMIKDIHIYGKLKVVHANFETCCGFWIQFQFKLKV